MEKRGEGSEVKIGFSGLENGNGIGNGIVYILG